MSHPLLTKVLADALREHHGPSFFPGGHDVTILGETPEECASRIAIPPDITDRLERALDVCAVCGMWSGWSDHEENQTVKALIGGSFHPYQPLVTP